jgi:hypothetical protein
MKIPSPLAIGRRRFLLGSGASLLLTLGGCASGSVAPEVASQIRTVGVVSALGDTVYIKKIGLLVFQNEQSTMSLAGTGIDDDVETAVIERLPRRMRAMRVPADRAAIQHPPANIFEALEGGDVSASVLAAARPPEPVDAYLVALRATTGDTLGQTNQQLHGLGIYHRSGGRSIHALYAAYALHLIDARQPRVLGTGLGLVPAKTPMLKLNTGVAPTRPTSANIPGSNPAALPEATRQQLANDFKALIRSGLPHAIENLKL